VFRLKSQIFLSNLYVKLLDMDQDLFTDPDLELDLDPAQFFIFKKCKVSKHFFLFSCNMFVGTLASLMVSQKN
jgi:hypothetical protein